MSTSEGECVVSTRNEETIVHTNEGESATCTSDEKCLVSTSDGQDVMNLMMERV